MSDASAQIPVPAGAGAGTSDTSADGANAAAIAAGGDADAAAAKAKEPAPEPEFEYEELENDKPVKRKVKMSEAQKRFSELSRTEKDIKARDAALRKFQTEQIGPLEQLIQDTRKDPVKLLDLAKRLGVDPRKAMEHLAAEELKLLNMTPEARRAYELEQEIARRDAIEAHRTQTETKARETAEVTAKQNELVNEIITAAQEAKLPQHPFALSLMSGFLRAQANAGQKPDAKIAAKAVNEFAKKYTQASLKDLTYDEIVATLPDVVVKIRQGDARKVTPNSDQGGPKPKPPPAPPKKPMTQAEFTAKLLRGE